MVTLYWIIGALGLLLCLYVFYAYKLKRNKPNIVGELETFPVPEKKSKVTSQLDEVLEDTKKQHKIDIVEELSKALRKEFPPPTKVDSVEVELEVTIDWFEKQKRKALRQLRHFKFNSLEFIPEWTFEENGKIFETEGYMLDASNTLNDVFEKHLFNKQRVVFYLSKESDGIYHIQKISGGKKTEATITIQVWCSDN